MADEAGARVAAIRKRLGYATPGAWIWWMSEEPPFAIDVRGKSIHPYIAQVERGGDAAFIASAKQDVEWLLAVRDALLARCAAAEARLVAARALVDCEWADHVPLLELVVLNDALGGERFPWDTPAWRAEHGLTDAARPGAGAAPGEGGGTR